MKRGGHSLVRNILISIYTNVMEEAAGNVPLIQVAMWPALSSAELFHLRTHSEFALDSEHRDLAFTPELLRPPHMNFSLRIAVGGVKTTLRSHLQSMRRTPARLFSDSLRKASQNCLRLYAHSLLGLFLHSLRLNYESICLPRRSFCSWLNYECLQGEQVTPRSALPVTRVDNLEPV